MKHLSMLIIIAGLPFGWSSKAMASKEAPMTREQAWDCISYGDDLLRSQKRMDDYARMQRHAKKRYNETTNRNYQRELAREHDRYQARYNSNVEDYNEILLPRYEKRCLGKIILQEDYQAVCNTRARMDNPFCKSIDEFRREQMRKKGWK